MIMVLFLKSMTLQQIKYFVAVFELRHFSRAARQANVAQPTLTLQLQKLEDKLGVALFDRSKTPVVPTDIGSELYIHAKEILRKVDEFEQSVNRENELVDGIYKLAIIPTVAPYLIPLFLRNFSKSHPNIKLEIAEMQSEDILRELRTGNVDIGIMATPTAEHYVNEFPIYNEPFLLYGRPDEEIMQLKEIDKTDIDSSKLWLLDQGHCLRDQVISLCNWKDKNKSQNVVLKGSSLETLKNVIRYDSGYTIIPALAARLEDDVRFIKPFAKPCPSREISIVSHAFFRKNKLVTLLAKSIKESLPLEISEFIPADNIPWK